MNKYRTHMMDGITLNDIGKEIMISGWVDTIRDHGGILFVDLRDESGIIQLVSEENEMFKHLTKESVIKVTGIVRKRDEEMINEKIATGHIEVLVKSMEVLSKAKNILPFEIKNSKEVSEEVRLKYRYLDLRNKKVHDNILLRTKVIDKLREIMKRENFTEIQTPILTASSPEGARDFIVPSRKYHGKFYALPQAPQIFKQLLMVSGFNKYFQIAPCFRDEDPRSDRLYGEFYQLDFEMSFVTEQDVYEIGEKIFYEIFTTFTDKKVTKPNFPIISYKESMLKYGTDKPDLRNPLIIEDLTYILKNTTFAPFKNKTIRGIKVKNIGNKPNSWFNEVVDYATKIGMPGIGYITLQENGLFKGPIDKFLTDEERKELKEKLDLKANDVLFFIADKTNYNRFASLIRIELGKKSDLIDENEFSFCIINDFPMYEIDEETNNYIFTHNPFSMPKGGLDSLLNQNPEEIVANQYDFVCNGLEMASGAVRNHNVEILNKAFEIAGYTEEEKKKKFSSLYTAFNYGAPPHAGMAPGIDRILMLLSGEENIRDVVAFPMNSSAQDLMMNSPSEVEEKQLREVHIKIRQKL